MLIVLIHNDGSGNLRTGNYDCEVLVNELVIAAGRIEGMTEGLQRPLVRKIAGVLCYIV